MNLLKFLPTPSFPLIGVVAAAAFAAGGWSGWYLTSDHYQAKEAKALSIALEEMQKEIKRGNDIAAATEEKVANIKIVNRTINKEVQREVTEKTVYRDCVIPPSGLQLWNAANSGATIPARKLDDKVPATPVGEGGRGEFRGITPKPR